MSYTAVRMDARERAGQLVDDGMISADVMLNACLQYMSLDEVEDMLAANYFEEEIDYE